MVKDLSLVTPVYISNEKLLEITEVYLGSLERNYPGLPVILVDDFSPMEEQIFDLAARYNESLKIQVVRNERNRGFAASVNAGVMKATTSRVAITNNDIYVPKLSLEKIIEAFNQFPRVGAVGPVTNGAGGYKQQEKYPEFNIESYGEIGKIEEIAQKVAMVQESSYEVNWATGFFLAFNRSALESVGGFDERFGLGYHEEMDAILRLRKAGYSIRVNPKSFIYHGVAGVKREEFGPSMSSRYFKAKITIIKNSLLVLAMHGPKEWWSLNNWNK